MGGGTSKLGRAAALSLESEGNGARLGKVGPWPPVPPMGVRRVSKGNAGSPAAPNQRRRTDTGDPPGSVLLASCSC